MSSKVASMMSAAAMLALLSQGVAFADRPSTGSTSSVQPPHRACKPKPAKPNHAAWPGSPSCCTQPMVWQERRQAGRPRSKTYWECVMPRPLHL